MNCVPRPSAELMDMEEAVEDTATQEPPVNKDSIWYEINNWGEKVLPKSLQRWRKARILINAFNRIRLFLERNKPSDKEKAEQKGNAYLEGIGELEEIFKPTNEQFAQFNSLDDLLKGAEECPLADQDEVFLGSSSPATGFMWNMDDAMQSGINDPSSTKGIESLVAGPALEELLKKFRIVHHFSSSDGKLKVVLESVGPVEPENFHQFTNDVHALFERSVDPELPSSISLMVPGPNAVPMMVPRSHAVPMTTRGPNAPESTMSVPDAFLLGNYPIQDGLVSQVRDPRAQISQVGDQHAQVSQVSDTFCNRTFSENTSMQEEDYGMGSVRYDQESRGRSDLDTQLELLRMHPEHPQLKDLVSDMKEQILRRIWQVNHASDREKMRSIKEDVEAASIKLQSTLKKCMEHLEKFFEELRKNAGQHLLIKATIDRFRRSKLKSFVHDTDSVVGKLSRVVSELAFRQMSASILYQDFANALCVLVDNFFEGHSSNFISVADFSDWYDWYLKSVYNIRHLSGGVGASGHERVV